MGFSIRSELASYARLKRRCYFLFVISYGGLLAGLTYAAMTHQSPPLWIGLIPGAALSVPLLLLPTQSWLPCLFHVLLGVVFAPIICARREADLSLIEAVELGRGGAGPHLPLLYPVQYAGKRRHTQKIRPGSEAEGLPRDGGMRFAAPCSRFSLSRAASPFACKRTKPRLGARAVRRSTGKGRRRAKSNGSGRRKEEDPFRKEAPSSFPIWLFYNSPAFSKASRASDRRPCTSRARESTSQPFRYSGRRATLWRASDSASSGSSPPSR
mgnify:CR=1 FL=1